MIVLSTKIMNLQSSKKIRNNKLTNISISTYIWMNWIEAKLLIKISNVNEKA